MPDKYAQFLKWYPYQSRESHRWRRMDCDEVGFFFRLYEWASTCKPRGALVSDGQAITIEDIAWELRMDTDRASDLMEKVMRPGVRQIRQNEKGIYYFPLFKTHQRKGPLRVRETGSVLEEAGLGRLWGEDGALEVEEEVEEEVEKEKEASLPKVLDTPAFKKAWTDWQQHRKEIRHALKPTTRRAQLKKLAKVAEASGIKGAIAMIEQSIEQGWQGLFEPKAKRTKDKDQKGKFKDGF